MADQFNYDVFLSLRSQDKAIVRPLAERLRADGLRVWFDEWVLKPGDSIPAKIEEGLEHSRVLVLCMSANAFDSDWAQLESGTFRFRDPLNKERRFIPLRLDDTPIKGSLAQFLYINWHTADCGKEYAKLLEACRQPATWPQSPENAGLPKQLDSPLPNPLASSEHEFVGKHRFELAEEALALFYQAKEIIESARAPAYFAGECASRKAASDESPEQKKIRDDAFVVLDRLKQNGEIFNRIQALRYRFMAQFGAGAVAPFDELKSILNRLFVSAHQWVMLSEVNERNFTNPQSLREHRVRIEKHDAVLWGTDGDDPILLRLGKAIEDIEQLCRPHLGRPR